MGSVAAEDAYQNNVYGLKSKADYVGHELFDPAFDKVISKIKGYFEYKQIKLELGEILLTTSFNNLKEKFKKAPEKLIEFSNSVSKKVGEAIYNFPTTINPMKEFY